MTQSRPSLPLGEYIFLRILQANPKLKSIFGVPGDYNLKFLEHLYQDSITEQGVKFVGCCNELNAAYASDGYARILQSFSVLITTLGVGELSAINGVAAAYSKFVPILHLVGATADSQRKHSDQSGPENIRNYHHLIQNKDPLQAPNHDSFSDMSSPISMCSETLYREDMLNDNVFDKIDNVLSAVLTESRPSYLFVPPDLVDIKVPIDRLEQQPFSVTQFNPSSIEAVESLNRLSDKIVNMIYESECPSIMADDLIRKFFSQDGFNKILDKVSENKFIRLYNSLLSKFIDETSDNFISVYPSPKGLRTLNEKECDLLIIAGFTNFETNGRYGFDLTSIKNYVEINPDYVRFNDEYFHIKGQKSNKRLFSQNDLFNSIAEKLDVKKLKQTNNVDELKKLTLEPKRANFPVGPERISQRQLYDFVTSYMEPNDIIISEVSSFAFDLGIMPFKPGVEAIYDSYYASIGYALPATLGVSMALKDLNITNRRVLLFEGDGSAQMSIQEFSTYLRNKVTLPQIFLMNNEGYTIERVIEGPERSYNDIQAWDWSLILRAFGDFSGSLHTYKKINNNDELMSYVTNRDDDLHKDKLELVELSMHKIDYSVFSLRFF